MSPAPQLCSNPSKCHSLIHDKQYDTNGAIRYIIPIRTKSKKQSSMAFFYSKQKQQRVQQRCSTNIVNNHLARHFIGIGGRADSIISQCKKGCPTQSNTGECGTPAAQNTAHYR
eukprot:3168136-Ditylum_brightwellii.AAC.1